MFPAMREERIERMLFVVALGIAISVVGASVASGARLEDRPATGTKRKGSISIFRPGLELIAQCGQPPAWGNTTCFWLANSHPQVPLETEDGPERMGVDRRSYAAYDRVTERLVT
jgi:hypothetical protein